MRCILFLLLFSPSITGFSQSSPLPLDFQSYAITISVSGDESISMTTRAGEIGLLSSLNDSWRKPDVKEKGSKPVYGLTIDQSNFFNRDTGFISGFFSNGSGYNIIYHTTDGGISWNPVNFGQSGWVDDAIHLDNGEAWLSVAGSGIAYTNDFGFNWHHLQIPDKKQRFSNIFFNSVKEGLAGSLWNMLAYTTNNGKQWKILPTPLDQAKYRKTNQESRPEFSRVAIYKNYFLVKQEELVFYTVKDSINWILLKDYTDFFTDQSSHSIFFKKGNHVFGIGADDFSLQNEKNIPDIIYDAYCKNGKLFAAGKNELYTLNAKGNLESYAYKFPDSEKIYPVVFGYGNTGSIGILDDKIYVQHNYTGPWEYLFTLPGMPEKTDYLSFTPDNQILLKDENDSVSYFSYSGSLILKTSVSDLLKNFARDGLSQIVFSQGSTGCFHNYSGSLSYSYINGGFSGAVEYSSGKNNLPPMPENSAALDEEMVLEFVKKLPSLFDPRQQAKISDLSFTEREYQQCRKDILDFEASINSTAKRKKNSRFTFSRNNIDFQRLLGLVDSVKTIPNELLTTYLMDLSDNWSTTINWKKITIVNSNGKQLVISSDYYQPNAFYFPWVISLNGISVSTTNFDINRFVNEVYPTFIESGERVKVLHTLVKKLYPE